MNDKDIVLPKYYSDIKAASDQIGFSMPSDLQTGSLLRTLVSSKRHGQFLELGTGTGLSLTWILESMDSQSRLLTIDNNPLFTAIAGRLAGGDPRVTILCADAAAWIVENQQQRFDLIFADAWPGKYIVLTETLALLQPGGFYVIDDMLHQPNWPEGHQDNVDRLVAQLQMRKDIRLTLMNWSTGIAIVTKI